MNTKKLRMPLDILMTLVSIVLMGGAYLFPADIVHEILGVSLFVLWAVHITLNRRWYASLVRTSKLITSKNANDRRSYASLVRTSKLITSKNANDRRSYASVFRGQYNGRRVLQTIINCGILVCVIFLMISGIILSNHIFTFLGIESGLGFARVAHLLASHWYFLFMSLHIGMHVEMILSKLKIRPLILRIILTIVCLYGVYAFMSRGVWKYLILRQLFFFFDLEKGYVVFILDYIAILFLFAAISHIIAKLLQEKKK